MMIIALNFRQKNRDKAFNSDIIGQIGCILGNK